MLLRYVSIILLYLKLIRSPGQGAVRKVSHRLLLKQSVDCVHDGAVRGGVFPRRPQLSNARPYKIEIESQNGWPVDA
jgi:hypothetical protein